jgi:ferrous iron transport protein A
MLLLGLLGNGDHGEIMEIREKKAGHERDAGCLCPDRQARLETMGIRVGKKVEMLKKSEGGGPLLIKVDESRIAISRGVAMTILVRRITL